MLDLQIASAQGDGLRDSLGDDAGFQAAEPGQRKSCTIVRVEAFGLDDFVAGDSETSLVRHLLATLVSALASAAAGSREQEYRAIGHHAVNVEQHQFDLLRAFIGHGEKCSSKRVRYLLFARFAFSC